jgi:hypothetical protein
MPVEYPTPVIEDRAVEVLTLLADRGQYRAPSVPDPIVAAELAGVTGQPAEWLIANQTSKPGLPHGTAACVRTRCYLCRW